MGNIGRKLEEDMDKKTMHYVPGIQFTAEDISSSTTKSFYIAASNDSWAC